MRFRFKQQKQVKIKSIKTRTKFAWFPTRLSNQTWIWLEKYCVKPRESLSFSMIEHQIESKNASRKAGAAVSYRSNWQHARRNEPLSHGNGRIDDELELIVRTSNH